MQTPEEFAWTLYAEEMDFHDHCWRDKDATVRLIAARDEAIRADERGRCSVVHATLTDEALVAELVRRGVLREERVGDNRICRCNLHRADPLLYAPCDAHEPITLPTRYVTEWEGQP